MIDALFYPLKFNSGLFNIVYKLSMQQYRDIIYKYINIHIFEINAQGLLMMGHNGQRLERPLFHVLLDNGEKNLRENDIKKSARGTDISNSSLY